MQPWKHSETYIRTSVPADDIGWGSLKSMCWQPSYLIYRAELCCRPKFLFNLKLHLFCLFPISNKCLSSHGKSAQPERYFLPNQLGRQIWPLGLVCPLGQSAAYIINREQVPHFIPTQFCFMCLEGGKLQSVIKVYNDLNVGVMEPQWTRFGDMRQSVIL